MKLLNWATRLACCVAVVLLTASVAQAQFTLIDDFGAYTLGSDINGQGGWTATGSGAGGIEVVADPTNAMNQVLRFNSTADDSLAYHSINIPNSNTAATLFFRTRRDGNANMSWGTSDVSVPTAFSSFETQFNIQDTSPSDLNVRDSGLFDLVDTMNVNTWYDMWMVIDNAANTFEVYMDDGSGVVQLDAGAQTDFVFRNGAASNSLLNVLMMAGAGHDANFFFDDIYIDTSGANLINPTTVPEPASLILWSTLGFLGLVFAGYVRRTKRAR